MPETGRSPKYGVKPRVKPWPMMVTSMPPDMGPSEGMSFVMRGCVAGISGISEGIVIPGTSFATKGIVVSHEGLTDIKSGGRGACEHKGGDVGP